MHRVRISNIGSPSDRVRKKMKNYAEESVDYAEKTPDYAAISKINKAVPLAFSNV